MSDLSSASIFSRFLAALGVPHTNAWSDKEFRSMTFKSLYGLSHLLNQYHVPNKAFRLTDKQEITKLTTPFLAQTNAGIFVIVNNLDREHNRIEYDSLGEQEKAPLADFIAAFNGIVLLAFPDANSSEPDYGSHRLTEIIKQSSNYALIASALIVFAWFFVTRGVYQHLSTILLTVFNCVGFYFSFLLLQKSLNIHTKASDRVCGVLEQGGCDHIMQTAASKLFGVFSWSEVGFGYFGVSLITLLVFPHMWPYLALCNVCCLPYTVWSITYQKFVAKHWCTLCVGVQATLWTLFFCYLGGGWLGQSLPLHTDFFILLAVYLFSVLFLNLILDIINNLQNHEKNS